MNTPSGIRTLMIDCGNHELSAKLVRYACKDQRPMALKEIEETLQMASEDPAIWERIDLYKRLYATAVPLGASGELT